MDKMKYSKEIEYRKEILSSALKGYVMNTPPPISEVLWDASTRYLINPGKFVRSLLYTLGCDEVDNNYAEEGHINNCIAIELMHTSTLVHDDIMDNDTLRRGTATIHTVFGEDMAILAGNLLYALAMDVAYYKGDINEIYKRINDGQALEIELREDILNDNVKREDYLMRYEEVAHLKTAYFVGASLSLPARYEDVEKEGVLELIGENIGLIYQIHNDAIDYTLTDRKDFCSDLREHKPTIVYFVAKMHDMDIFEKYSYYYEKFASGNEKYASFIESLKAINESINVSDAGERMRVVRDKLASTKYFVDDHAHIKASQKVLEELRSGSVFKDVYEIAKGYYDDIKEEIRNLDSNLLKWYLEEKLLSKLFSDLGSLVKGE